MSALPNIDAGAAKDLSDDDLLDRLRAIQRAIRDLLVRYKIPSGSFSEMAHRARRSISNTETRADFLELLINLQELGSEAKQRAVLDEAGMTSTGQLTDDAFNATARRKGGEPRPNSIAKEAIDKQESDDETETETETEIDQQATDRFFKSLDQ